MHFKYIIILLYYNSNCFQNLSHYSHINQNLSKYFHLAVTGDRKEHTSELQSPYDLVCRLLLEKKKKKNKQQTQKKQQNKTKKT